MIDWQFGNLGYGIVRTLLTAGVIWFAWELIVKQQLWKRAGLKKRDIQLWNTVARLVIVGVAILAVLASARSMGPRLDLRQPELSQPDYIAAPVKNLEREDADPSLDEFRKALSQQQVRDR